MLVCAGSALVMLVVRTPFHRAAATAHAAFVVERGGLALGALHDTPGPGRVRVKRFIVQQSDDDPDTDDIPAPFSHTSGPEFAALGKTLPNIAGVRTCRPDTSSRSFV